MLSQGARELFGAPKNKLGRAQHRPWYSIFTATGGQAPHLETPFFGLAGARLNPSLRSAQSWPGAARAQGAASTMGRSSGPAPCCSVLVGRSHPTTVATSSRITVGTIKTAGLSVR